MKTLSIYAIKLKAQATTLYERITNTNTWIELLRKYELFQNYLKEDRLFKENDMLNEYGVQVLDKLSPPGRPQWEHSGQEPQFSHYIQDFNDLVGQSLAFYDYFRTGSRRMQELSNIWGTLSVSVLVEESKSRLNVREFLIGKISESMEFVKKVVTELNSSPIIKNEHMIDLLMVKLAGDANDFVCRLQ